MSNSRLRIALLIPTRNRREDLKRLFKSLLAQTRQPNLVMLIDGGEDLIEDFLKTYPSLPMTYVRVYPPGLTKQRNAGLDQVPKDIDLVAFLDDDLELFPDALERMMAFWEEADNKVGGASFNIVNNDITKVTWLRRFFYISSPKGGSVLPSGFNNILSPVQRDTQTQWLCGGATVWRAELFKTHRFEENYPGYGHFDDLDFSLSLGGEWTLMVLKEAKVYHHSHPFRKDKFYTFGSSDTINRYLFVRRFKFPILAFAWATLGHIIGTFLSGLVRRDRGRIDLAMGAVRGLGLIVTGRTTHETALDIK